MRARERNHFEPPLRTEPRPPRGCRSAHSPFPSRIPPFEAVSGQKFRFCVMVISRTAQKASRRLSVAFLASGREIYGSTLLALEMTFSRVLRKTGALGTRRWGGVVQPSLTADGASGTRRWVGAVQPSLAAFGPRQNLVSPSISRSFTFLPVPPSLSAKRATREIGAHGGFAASLATLHTPSRASPPRAKYRVSTKLRRSDERSRTVVWRTHRASPPRA